MKQRLLLFRSNQIFFIKNYDIDIGGFKNEVQKQHLVEQFLPVVLCHETEKSQKSPAKGIKTGVAIVWISSYFQAVESIWTLPVMYTYTVVSQGTDDYTSCLITLDTMNSKAAGKRYSCVSVHAAELKTSPVSTCSPVTFDSTGERKRMSQ